MTRLLADRTYKALFHLLFWGLLLVVPSVEIPRPFPKTISYSWANHLIVVSTSLLVFFVNSQVLIPKIFAKYSTLRYLLSLFGLVTAGGVYALVTKEILQYFSLSPESFPPFPFPIPILFVAAISSAYGLVVYFNQQERQREAQNQRQKEVAAERLRSELSFLRSQISPHFIFNVLNSLNYLIHKNSPEAKTVVVKLADLMRYMLYEADDTQVKLNKEIEYLNNYIDLQKIRFGDDVDIQTDMVLTENNASIEPMLLIPFIENAFKHGVATRNKPFVHVNLAFKNNILFFGVRNSRGTEVKSQEMYSGIGLKNIKRRLELLYPKHQLEMIKTPDNYQVELILGLNK